MIYKIYLTLQAILDKYISEGKSSPEFLKGFSICLHLLKTGLKKYPQLNLHIENKLLEDKLKRQEHYFKKEIQKLQLDLDDAAEDIAVLKRVAAREIELDTTIEGDINTVHFYVGYQRLSFISEAPQEVIDAVCPTAINKAFTKNPKPTKTFLLNYVVNYMNAQGYKSRQIK